METLSVALALSGGELADRFTGLLDEHPMLDLCGIARSIPDLSRLLKRFRPDALLVSSLVIEEWGTWGASPDASGPFPPTPSFLLVRKDARLGKEDLERLFGYPFTFCGAIDTENMGAEKLYELLSRGVAAFAARSGPAMRPDREGSRGGTGCIMVSGSKGGVGSTLIACVLASSLAQLADKVLLTELDGDRSQLLHLKPPDEGKTLLELLPLAEEISWDLARVSMYRHQAGFRLLPFGRPQTWNSKRAAFLPDALFRNLCFLFDFVVVDLAGHLTEWSAPLLRLAQGVVLVSTPDALSVRCARQAAARLRGLGLDTGRIHLVINRTGTRHSLQLQDITQALGLKEAFPVPSDRRSGLDFADLGMLPRAGSPLVRSVSPLVERITGGPSARAATAGNGRGRSPWRTLSAAVSGRSG